MQINPPVNHYENEISFNITPDEDEIKRDLNLNENYSEKTFLGHNKNLKNSKEIIYEQNNIVPHLSHINKEKKFYIDSPQKSQKQEENFILQHEAKDLIDKTRRMMENLDVHKFNDYELKRNLTSVDKSFNKNIPSDDYIEEKPSDYKKIIKVDNSPTNQNNFSFNNTNSNVLNQKLLDKIKHIKILEKEIKEKNLTIDKLNSKLDKQTEEIKKLNDKLNVNRYFLK